MKLLLFFISLFPVVTLGQVNLAEKWGTCENSWYETNPELYEVHHPTSEMTLMRTEWLDKVKDNIGPAFYITNGNEASVLRFPAQDDYYGSEKRFYFQSKNQLYCISYVSRMILPDQIKRFQKISKPEDCPQSIRLESEKITTQDQEQKLVDTYRKRFMKNLDVDIRLALKADEMTTLNKAAYDRIKKWNSQACVGLNERMRLTIEDAKNAIQNYEKVLKASQKSSTTSESLQQGAR